MRRPLTRVGRGAWGEDRDLRSLALPPTYQAKIIGKGENMLKVRFFLNEPNGKP